MTDRTFDIVLFGATGFTGRLVAEYLANHAPSDVRIALAGRNTSKLEGIRAGLPERARAWPLVVADSADAASLEKLASQTKVVCTTVGPYAKYGLPLVAACAKAGTHYCDLTGEPQFMRDSIDLHHETAKASGARIVHTCGFDSIPSDLGVLGLFEALGPLTRATYVVEILKGGASGGTIASALNGLDQAKTDKKVRKSLVDPYALSADRAAEPKLGDERDQSTFRFDDFVGQWTAPFIMASVNTRVVRRSNSLRGHAYGKAFRYAEVSGMKKGPRGFFRAATFTAGLGLFVGSLLFGPTRKLVESRLPKPGEGPSEETRKNGFLRVRVFGESEGGVRKTMLIEGKGDPGYQLTSLLLGESALCLARDDAKLPKVAGVLTPATAMGRVLTDRLVAAGMVFKLE
ncbi:MAG: saccharopine dehydrogenase NADP-binding domain-containing protein [Archangium sp.]|nr:saccharopine dehydrogenase NADP-binding domain-containing protein [Archangium sp.]